MAVRADDAVSMPSPATIPCGHRSVVHTVQPHQSAAACPVPVGTKASESNTMSVDLQHRIMSSYPCLSFMLSLVAVV